MRARGGLQGLWQGQLRGSCQVQDAVAGRVKQHVDSRTLLQAQHSKLEGTQRLLPVQSTTTNLQHLSQKSSGRCEAPRFHDKILCRAAGNKLKSSAVSDRRFGAREVLSSPSECMSTREIHEVVQHRGGSQVITIICLLGDMSSAEGSVHT